MSESVSYIEKSGTNGFVIRLLRQEDIPKLLDNRRRRMIHIPLSDIQMWATWDPEGIRVVENDSGEIVGTCSVIKQHENMYFSGLYHIEEEYRGLGIGKQIWNMCLDHAGAANVGLNTMPEKLELYRDKAGFSIVETDFIFNIYSTLKPVNPKDLSSDIPQGVIIEPFNKSHLPHIYAYDFGLLGYERERVLEMSCQAEDTRTLVAFKNGVCVGFGSIKMCFTSGAGRVGPLYADDSAVAEVMLRNLIVSLPGVTGFAMETLSTNSPANLFLSKLGILQSSVTPRMYNKERMVVDTSKIFAVFDLIFTPF